MSWQVTVSELYIKMSNIGSKFHFYTLDIIKVLVPTDAEKNCFERGY